MTEKQRAFLEESYRRRIDSVLRENLRTAGIHADSKIANYITILNHLRAIKSPEGL